MKTEKPASNKIDHELQIQEAVRNAAAYIAQLQRILWLTVQAAGGKVTLDESKVDPLWRLDKIRLEDKRLVLTSSVTPPPTADDLDRLVNALTGTAKLIEDVQKEAGLEAWPPDYLAFHLKDRLAIFNGKWMDAAIARGLAGGHQARN